MSRVDEIRARWAKLTRSAVWWRAVGLEHAPEDVAHLLGEVERLREALQAIADGGRGGCHDVAREALRGGGP